MKRRSFLKSILGAVASIALAQKITLDALNLEAPEPACIPNPAYEDAQFEVAYLYHPDVISMAAMEQGFDALYIPVKDEGPIERYNYENGKWVKVPPHIKC